MRPQLVVLDPVVLGEHERVVDLFEVNPLLRQRAEAAFTGFVLSRRLYPGPHVVQRPRRLLTHDGVIEGAASIGRRPQTACAAVGLVLSSGDDSFFFRRDTRAGGRLWSL